ncbi:MAG: hypothetical protein AB7G28_18165 [Pirellulales bacterium]
MASVAICPHCYLQLVVPDGIEPDELVECPTCAKEFDIARAVLRAIPEVVRRPKSEVAEPVTEAAAAHAHELTIADTEEEVQVDEVLEIAADDKLSQEPDVIEEIKSHIERELAGRDLLPETSAALPLEEPVAETDDSLESPEGSTPDFMAESVLLDEWHRPTVRIHDLTTSDTRPIRITPQAHDPADAEDSIDDLEDDVVGDDVVEELEDELVIAAVPPEALPPHEELPLAAEFPLAAADTTVDEQLESIDEEPEFIDERLDADEKHLEPVAAQLESFDDELNPADDRLESAEDQLESPDYELDDQLDQLDVEPAEPPAVRPGATTLADLMPRDDWMPRADEYAEREEAADAPGPSFDLPNVALTPNNGATIEFDSSMSLGPAAESEFELDQVDFDSTPDEEQLADEELLTEDEPIAYEELVSDEYQSDEYQSTLDEEPAEADAAVFAEPGESTLPATPFVLPGVPRPRKKRSVVRLLAGVALGGVVGTIGAFYALLWILGPDGDFLQVAQYLPSAVLPSSFHPTPAPRLVQSEPPVQTESTPAEPENIPATFTEEVKKPEEDATAAAPPASDDRYATEPSPLDEPKAEPIAEATTAPASKPLPIQGTAVSVDQLSSALAAAKSAEAGLTTGDLSDAAVRRTKGMSYAKLCDLAEAVTFVDRAQSPSEAEQLIDDSKQLFRAVLSDPHTRSEIDRIATIWITSPHRRHGGVFLAGTLSGGEIAGDVYQYQLETEDHSTLTLLSAEPLDPAVESSLNPAGIVGSIIDHPAGVTGYTGTADRAIWVTQAIPLE